MTSLVPICYGSYSANAADTADYLPGWQPVGNTTAVNGTIDSSSASAYFYSSPKNTLGAIVQAASGDASGAGYIANLDSSLASSQALLANLSASGWIDQRSRLVYIEFLAFNPSTYLYTVGYSALRMESTGIMYEPAYYALLLDRYGGASGGLRVLIEMLTAILLLCFIVSTCMDLRKGIKQFCADGWMVYDMLISVVTVATMVVCGVQAAGAAFLQNQIEKSPRYFTNLQVLCKLDYAATVLLSLVAFLLTVRLLKWIRLHRRLRMMVDVLLNASGSLTALIFLLITVLLAFTESFYLIFFSTSAAYSTFSRSLIRVVGALVYSFEYESDRSALGSLLFVLYVLLLAFVLTRMFVPTLACSHKLMHVQFVLNSAEDDVSGWTYFAWKMKLFLGCEDRPNDDDSRFEYLAGVIDYEKVFDEFTEKMSDFSSKVKKVHKLAEYGDPQQAHPKRYCIKGKILTSS